MIESARGSDRAPTFYSSGEHGQGDYLHWMARKLRENEEKQRNPSFRAVGITSMFTNRRMIAINEAEERWAHCRRCE